ncbi:MAG: insulinase family protein [Gammaproteobacteria bacterium]|nr:insulinase family protein [Gammaproteobacteria bacterium]
MMGKPLFSRLSAVLVSLSMAAVVTTFSAAFSVTAIAGSTIQHWQTSNGADVYFFPAHELPMVDVQVVFDAGSARDGDQSGLALLTNALLDDGAGEWDADRIAERFEDLGVEFGLSAARDMAVVGLRSLTDDKLLQPALDTLAQVLSAPTFPQDALERERNQMLIALKGQQQSPAAIASKAFYHAVYGKHPYGSPTLGSVESVTALQREDIVAFHRRFYTADNAIVAIVGDLQRQDAETMAAALVADLPTSTTVKHTATDGAQSAAVLPVATPDPQQQKKARISGWAAAAVDHSEATIDTTTEQTDTVASSAAHTPLPAVKPLSESYTVIIEHPSTQTHIRMGQPGMKRGDPDYFVLYVGNHVLGGSGLVSRISNEVREKRGLSYSASSHFNPMRELGPFTIGLQTRNDQVDEALQVVRDTLDAFVTDGPTEAELKAAKQNITGGFPLRIASNKKMIGYLAMIGFYGLPLDYLDNFIGTINAVTVDQIKDAFKRRIHPDKMVTIIVGGTDDAAQDDTE